VLFKGIINLKKYLLALIVIFPVFTYASDTPTEKTKWQKLLGQWSIVNSQAVENRAWAAPWEYYELLKYNTIITYKAPSDFNNITVKASTFDRFKTPSEFMISFAITSERASWFYHMYAFKITGGFWGMDKVTFIKSDRLDKSKPFNAKNNSFVKEIASADCSVKYDKTHEYSIKFEGHDAVLYINGKKILSVRFPEKSHKGRIAISSKNVKVSVDSVEVKKNKKTVFEDDFNEDSIYMRRVKARISGANNDKKPE